MSTVPSKTDRDVVTGTEYLAGAAGGSDYKVLVGKIKDYVISFFSNKTQLDKISESVGLPLYNSKPFGSLIQVVASTTKSTDFSIDLDYCKILYFELDTETDYTISFANIASGAIVVVVLKPTAAVTLTWDEDIKWVDGEALTAIASGEEVRLSIASDGTTNAGITINYVNVALYNWGS
jgi:hypothetical protein